MINYLLVLGLVPGTNFQITFYEYLALLPAAGTILYLRKHRVSRAELSRQWQYARVYLSTRPGSQLSLHL